MDERPEMLEPFGVPDVFVSGMGNAEHIGGGNWRFTFFVNQDVAGETQKVVAAKIVMSIEELPAAIHMAARLTSTCACENARRMVRN